MQRPDFQEERLKHFCTYFDHNFLSRGLCLYKSLRQYEQDFTLWVLCLSEECLKVLREMEIPEIKLISLEQIELYDAELKSVEKTRSRVEYYFTMSPCLPIYIMAQQEGIEDVTYLDADLYFFDSYKRVFQDIAEASVAIIPHNYVPEMLRSGADKNGIYNVGWITWKNNNTGKECLKWWRRKCLEWCYDRHEEGRFADQKYLDAWPDLFKDVKILCNPGFNLAPWNAGNYSFEKKEAVYVSGEKLIFYHFHGLKQMNQYEFDCHLRTYYVGKQKTFLIENIYKPYINELVVQNTKPAGSIRAKSNSLTDKLKLQIKKVQTRLSGDVISTVSSSG